ncbi:hypothetical protein ACVTNV_000620 [Vibrio alginolyticus]
MSQFLANMYLQFRQEDMAIRAVEHKASLHDWYERQRSQEMQAEMIRQRELEASKIHARESFYANLDTRRLDLQHMIVLYPLAYNLTVDWWRFCGCQEFLGRIAGLSLDAAAADSFGGSTYRYREHLYSHRNLAYDNIGKACNDVNPHLQQRVMASVALLSKYLEDHSPSEELLVLTSSRASKLSKLVMGFMGMFAILGERSSAQPFQLFWSMPKQQRESLLALDTAEGELFRTFCPSDASLSDDLIRMRGLFFLAKYHLVNREYMAKRTPASDGLTSGLVEALPLDAYLSEHFEPTQMEAIRLGVQGLVAAFNDCSYTEDQYRNVMTLHEQFPLVYASCSTLLLLMRVNRAAFDDIMVNCINEPDDVATNISESVLASVVGMERFFPEQTYGDNHEVWQAVTACNINKCPPESRVLHGIRANPYPVAQGTILPKAESFTKFEGYMSQSSSLVGVDIDSALMQFLSSDNESEDCDYEEALEVVGAPSVDEEALFLELMRNLNEQRGAE